jgi:hypothetical protein
MNQSKQDRGRTSIARHSGRSRARNMALGAAGALLVSGVASVAGVPAQAAEPPAAGHQIISFPQRDFVSATGYVMGVDAYVEVIRGGVPIAISTPIQPEDDPATSAVEGLVEVNHPGGGCWSTVTGTPDIRPGDKVRVFQEQDDPGTPGVIDMIPVADDTTTTASVTAGRPVVSGLTVTVTGTAQTLDGAGNPTGAQIPLDQIEQRLINKDKFSFNGRRDLRAPRDGTLKYDSATSINWTATYTLKSTADVPRVNASESRVLWLGRVPGAANESTIYENGTGVFAGPAAPCTAPLQGTTATPQAPVPPAQSLLPAAGTVSAPVSPHSLIAFPSRDFISADGYTPGHNVVFSVLRNGTLVGQSDPVTVDDAGLAEVNHPGGGCFIANTQTPNLRVGDVVRVTDLTTSVAEETTVANVTANKPTSPSTGTVVVTGTALNADGTAKPLAQVEQRFVNSARFANGSRTLRSSRQGTLVAGPTPGTWVATYTGLSSADVTKALKGETRALWLGPVPGAGTELTTYELPDALSGVLNGVMDGPTPPCTAPAEA